MTILVDQSKSISLHFDSLSTLQFWQKISDLTTTLERRGATVELINLEGKSVERSYTGFRESNTDLDQGIKSAVQKRSAENHQHVILISDGVVNKGYNPADRYYPLPVSCIGLGDSTPIVDTYLEELVYNQQIYSNSDFPIKGYIASKGLNSTVTLPVQVKLNGEIIKESKITLGPDAPYSSVDFLIPGQNPGVYLYEINVGRVQGEKIPQNNFSNLYIEVVNSKTRILLAAASPHPDLQAIRSVAESLDQIELKVAISGVNDLPKGPFDLVIYHQIPHASGAGNEFLKKEEWDKQALWFITGAASQFNALQNTPAPAIVKLKSLNADQARLILNPSFKQLEISSVFLDRLPKLPPVAVPFADQQLQPNTEVVFYQKIGQVDTERPLLSISTTYPKRALWTGDGLWTLRMEEYALYGSAEGFDTWMGQWLQLLSAKEDKRKLRVYPNKNEYQEGEEIKLNIEAFNDILEPIYGTVVNIQIAKKGSNQNYKFQYTLSEGLDGLNPGMLNEGIYQINADAVLNGKPEKATSKFIVKDLQTELSNRVADFGTLRALANGNSGKFFTYAQWDLASDSFEDMELTPLLHTEETERKLIQEVWLYLLVIGLISTEWIIRKIKGIY